MGKEYQDGLLIDNSFLMIDEKKPGFPVSARAVQILAILAGSWSFISELRECIAIPVNVYQINAILLICTGIMAALCLIPSYDAVKQFFCILFYGLFFCSRLPKLLNGFYIIENLIINRLAAYYNYTGVRFEADYTHEIRDTTLLVIMILIPVAALLAIAVIRNHLVRTCCLLLFLPISVSFLFGLIPSEKYLITYVTVVLYLSRSGTSYRYVTDKSLKTLLHRINCRAGVWLSLLGLLAFFFLKLFISDSEYDSIYQIQDMKNRIQSAMMNFSYNDFTQQISEYKIFDSSISIGGLRGGDLAKTGNLKYTNSEQLVVTAPDTSVEEGIYLKGYVGSNYTGTRWEGHSKEDRDEYKAIQKKMQEGIFSPVEQTNQLLTRLLASDTGANSLTGVSKDILPLAQIYQGNLEIEYKEANHKFIYAPYLTDYSSLDKVTYVQDLYAAPGRNTDHYEFNYYFNLNNGGPVYSIFADKTNQFGSYPDYEKLYRSYVHRVYTRLPEKGLERLKKDFNADSIKAESIMEKIDYVKNYLEKNTKYTLSPGSVPKGKDFVEYFLYENKKGYCTHYASAAVLMLRAMGVPARYVEGYAIGPSQASQKETGTNQNVGVYDGETRRQSYMPMVEISVKDSDAHAWAEVYIDGCGWLPVECTPGSSIQYNSQAIYNLSLAKDYIKSENKDKKEPTKAPEEPTQALTRHNNKTMKKPDQQASSDQKAAKKEQKKLNAVFIAAFILLSIAAVTSLLLFKIRKRKLIRHTRNRNKRAIYLFMEVEKILSSCRNGLPGKGTRLEDSEKYVRELSPYVDAATFGECMEIVRKARFGRNSITVKELNEVEAFRQKLYREVYEKLPFIRKIRLKIILII